MGRKLDEACPIWGTLADVWQFDYDGRDVDSPRAGGTYRVSSSAIAGLGKLDKRDRAKLTTWLVDQRRAGIERPEINSVIVREIGLRRPLSFAAKLDRFFLLLHTTDFGVLDRIPMRGLVTPEMIRWKEKLQAWMELSDERELGPLLVCLEEGKLVRADTTGAFVLSSQGLLKLDALRAQGAESDQAFVAMWFSPEMDAAFADGFALAIEDNGYRAFRIDQKEHNNKIDDEIIAEIRRSHFVVADFTSGIFQHDGQAVAIARGGVYYEAGFAQGLNIPVIWSVRADCIGHVHFDTRQYAHIVWSDPADLRAKLRNRIGAVIGQNSR